MTTTVPKEGDFVWICVPSYPWWPARVRFFFISNVLTRKQVASEDDPDIGKEVKRDKNDNDILVKFFQSNDLYVNCCILINNNKLLVK